MISTIFFLQKLFLRKKNHKVFISSLLGLLLTFMKRSSSSSSIFIKKPYKWNCCDSKAKENPNNLMPRKEEEEEETKPPLILLSTPPIIQNIEKITKELNQTPKQLFIKQLIYSAGFIRFFLNVSQCFCKDKNQKYILLNESQKIKYDIVWKFHEEFWLNYHLEKECNSKIKGNAIENVKNINKYFPSMAFQLKFIKITSSSSCSSSSAASSASPPPSSHHIQILFHPNTARVNKNNVNFSNSIILNLDDFNGKQLGLLLTIINKEESLYFEFDYFSQENFILQYHIFILLFTFMTSYEDVLFCLQKLNRFIFGMLFDIFADNKRRRALLSILSSFSKIKPNNSKKIMKNEIYSILSENVINVCAQSCCCCHKFIYKLWLSL